MTPLLHVSQRYPAERMCAAAVLPLARHPKMDSRVIVFDLDADPDLILDLEPEAIAARLYLRRDQLAEGEARIPLKEVHLNRCPKSEEHTSELQSLMRISYAVFCLK